MNGNAFHQRELAQFYKDRQKEINRLLFAAKIDTTFGQMFMRNPRQVISLGYGSESFNFNEDEQLLIEKLVHHSVSLTHLMRQITDALGETNCYKNGHQNGSNGSHKNGHYNHITPIKSPIL